MIGAAALIAPLAAAAPAAALMSDGPVFISEIHYDNAGTDEGEAIEVQAPVGTDLSGWQIVLYNGNGGGTYGPVRELGVVPEAGVLVAEYPENGIQNGEPDGVALVDAEGTVVEFLSYEGDMTASGGPADGMDSTDIGVAQLGGDPVGESLQRVDGEWIGPVPSSFGAVNQAPEPEPDPEPGEVVPIADIQGTGDVTPLDGTIVTTRGVVTAAYPTGGFNGVYIQTPGTGGDLTGHTASHGIFVYGGNDNVTAGLEIGDHVEVTGTAGEYFTLTQITAQLVDELEESAEPVVPAQIEWPETDAERERLEGMLVAPQGSFTVTDTYPTNRYGSVTLAAGTEPLRQPTDVARPESDAAAAVEADNAARAVTLDDGSSWEYTNFDRDNHETPVPYLSLEDPVRVGAAVTFTDPVIVDYRFQWNFQPTTQATGENDAAPATFADTRTAAPQDVGGDVTLASFNVLNYFTSLGEDEGGCEFYPDRDGDPTTTDYCDVRGAYDGQNLARQTAKIVAAINALDADVVALEEIENSVHFSGDAPEDRDHALAALVAALDAEAGEGSWAYVESPTDVPADEDVIRNAFIYQPDAVTPVGASQILVGDEAFSNAREPLAQEFAMVDEAGEPLADADTFVAVTNHFKSKGSGSGENADQGDGQGASNPDRIEQAEALVAFADDVAQDAGTELVLLVGDFNAYTMEDPMMVFDDAGYTNIGQTMTDKSTYSFDGLVGSLDHILGNEAATAAVTGADIWNINAYEAVGLEYSRYNYNVTDLYDETPYRSSDHDPIVVGLDLVEDDVEEPVEPPVEPPADLRYGFFLNNGWGPVADTVFQYGRHNDEVLIGDWDDDGKDTITVRRGHTYYVNNAAKGGAADREFTYGRTDDTVLVGDWDGDGVDTLAVRRGNRYFVKNSLEGGDADVEITYGRAGDQVLVGNWNGEGGDTFAVRRGNHYFVKNSVTTGNADEDFTYGRAADHTLVGDWDGDGADTFAVRRGNEYFINNSLTSGNADLEIHYGRAGDTVYVGDWDGDGHDTLGVRRTP